MSKPAKIVIDLDSTSESHDWIKFVTKKRKSKRKARESLQAFHLPGKHDQKSHGSGGKGSKAGGVVRIGGAGVSPEKLSASLGLPISNSAFERDAIFHPDGMPVVATPGHVYRGMEKAEYDATVGAGKGVKSRQDYSLPGEGTSITDDAAVAEDFVNFGRSSPANTGNPTYLVEMKQGPDIKMDHDGYLKAQKVIPHDRVTRVWKMDVAKNGDIRADEIDTPKEDVKSREFHLPGGHRQGDHAGGDGKAVVGGFSSAVRDAEWVDDYEKLSETHPSNGYNSRGVKEPIAAFDGPAWAKDLDVLPSVGTVNKAYDEAERRQEVINAFGTYQGGGYSRINKYLRGVDGGQGDAGFGLSPGVNNTVKKVRKMDEAFEEATPLAKPIIVQRGMGSGKRTSSLKVGDEFTDAGFVSVSTSESKAASFGKAQAEIRLPKGTKAIPVAAITGDAYEAELVLPRGSRFRVVEVESPFQVQLELIQ